MQYLITGSCLCGKVNYQVNEKPIAAGNCHCRTCQRAVGAAYLAALFIPYNALKITGIYKEYASLSVTGNSVHRGFCTECGSMLFARNSANDKIRPVNAATLTDPSIYQPTMDFWVADAQPWDYMNPNLEKFEQNPERF